MRALRTCTPEQLDDLKAAFCGVLSPSDHQDLRECVQTVEDERAAANVGMTPRTEEAAASFPPYAMTPEVFRLLELCRTLERQNNFLTLALKP